MHEEDKREEWRPAFIQKDSAPHSHDHRQYLVRWLFPPAGDAVSDDETSTSKPAMQEEQMKWRAERERKRKHKLQPTLPAEKVLLAPRFPKFDYDVIKEHEEYLKQAVPLRQAGKSDQDIEIVLRQLMDEDKQRKKEQEGEDHDHAGAAIPITLDEIRSYLQRKEEETQT